MPTYKFETDSKEANDKIADSEPKHVWIDGATTWIFTEEDIPNNNN